MTEYDDERYVKLTNELTSIIGELLDMEGNTEELIRGEVDNAFENAA